MIFIDSTYLISRLIKNDTFHVRSIELESQLNEKRFINSTVLVETLDSFINCGGKEIDGLFEYLLEANELLSLDEKDFVESVDLYSDLDYEISFSNCTILQSMKALGIDKIATFDPDFKKIDGITVID